MKTPDGLADMSGGNQLRAGSRSGRGGHLTVSSPILNAAVMYVPSNAVRETGKRNGRDQSQQTGAPCAAGERRFVGHPGGAAERGLQIDVDQEQK